MSRFAEQFERVGAPALINWFADSISYTDAVLAAPIAFDAMLTREIQERRKNASGGWSVVTIRTARFITADVDETLRIDGTVTIGIKFYSIEHIDAIEGAMTLVHLKRVEPGEVTRPFYRGR